MRFRRLDLNLLVALDVLLAEKSITRAARRLHISQPTTSGVLARLREYFNDDLLVQVGRTLELTPLATSLIEPLRDVLLRIEATIETRPQFDPAHSSRHFEVIASDYITTVILAEVGRQMSLQAPRTTMDIVALADNSYERLDRGEVELLFAPKQYCAKEHPHEVIFEETFTCITWAGNTEVNGKLTKEKYLSLGHVISKFSSLWSNFEEVHFQKEGLQRRVEIATGNFNNVPQLLMGTNRVATMHTRLAHTFAQHYPLTLFKPPVDIPKLELAMQWHQFFENDLAHQWLRAQIRDAARSGGLPE